jgi:hypothetical protein
MDSKVVGSLEEMTSNLEKARRAWETDKSNPDLAWELGLQFGYALGKMEEMAPDLVSAIKRIIREVRKLEEEDGDG